MLLKRFLAPGVLSAVLLLAVSCKGDGTLGQSWKDISTRIMLIDTCSIELLTMKYDSIATLGTGVMFAGRHGDTHFGNTTAAAYLSFNTVTAIKPSYSDHFAIPVLGFDSLTLILGEHSDYWGDTTRRQKLNICLLTEQITLAEDDALYSSSSFDYDPSPIATLEFDPYPNSGRTHEIRLPDHIGRDFFNRLRAEDDNFATTEDFGKYFPGLVIVPDASSGMITSLNGADSLTMIRLYYHETADKRDDRSVDFTLNTSLQFNNLSYDRSGSATEGVASGGEGVPSYSSDGLSFVQPIAGMYMKIKFPYLHRLQELGQNVRLVSGTLYIYPERDSFGRHAQLPDALSVYISDETNATVDAITTAEGEMETGTLSVNTEFGDRTLYSVDISSYLKDQLTKFGIYKRDLQLTLPDDNSTLKTLTAYDQSHERGNIQVVITLTTYDE